MIRHLGPRTDVPGLLADATEEGRDPVVVPAGPDKAGTLAAFADRLGFPDWFGGNLDALADCLDDLAAALTGDREVVWDGVARLRESDPDTAAAVTEILGEAATAYPRLHVTVIDR